MNRLSDFSNRESSLRPSSVEQTGMFEATPGNYLSNENPALLDDDDADLAEQAAATAAFVEAHKPEEHDLAIRHGLAMAEGEFALYTHSAEAGVFMKYEQPNRAKRFFGALSIINRSSERPQVKEKVKQSWHAASEVSLRGLHRAARMMYLGRV